MTSLQGGGVWVYLLDAVVEEGEAGVLVADEGALLDEADEDLRLGQLGVELLVGAVAALQEPWRNVLQLGHDRSGWFIHTPRPLHAMQGVTASWSGATSVSRLSGTPEHSARRSRGSN